MKTIEGELGWDGYSEASDFNKVNWIPDTVFTEIPSMRDIHSNTMKPTNDEI